MLINNVELKVVTNSVVVNGVRTASYQVRNADGLLVDVGSAKTEYGLDGQNKVTVYDYEGNVVTDLETSMVKAKHYLLQFYLDNPEKFIQHSKEALAKEKRRERDRARRAKQRTERVNMHPVVSDVANASVHQGA